MRVEGGWTSCTKGGELTKRIRKKKRHRLKHKEGHLLTDVKQQKWQEYTEELYDKDGKPEDKEAFSKRYRRRYRRITIVNSRQP